MDGDSAVGPRDRRQDSDMNDEKDDERKLTEIAVKAILRRRYIALFLLRRRMRNHARVRQRRGNIRRRRVELASLIESITPAGFVSRYRLSVAAFYKLLSLTHKHLQVDSEMAVRSSGSHISTGVVLAIGLRYLAGSRPVDNADIHGVSVESVYRCLDRVIDAINKILTMPPIEERLQELEVGFAAKSTGQVIRGCVGAIDGLHVKISQPSLPRDGVQNGARYYVSRKGAYAWNVQAICDASRRFTFVDIRYPGSTGDHLAFLGSTKYHDYDSGSIPHPFFLVGDAAYALKPRMLTPFKGSKAEWNRRNLDGTAMDSFNFYLSQLRINIECAFGILVRRWGVLWRPLEFSHERQPKLIMACALLHNFCMDNNGTRAEQISRDSRSHVLSAHQQELGYPAMSKDGTPVQFLSNDATRPAEDSEDGVSRRQIVMQDIKDAGYVRP